MVWQLLMVAALILLCAAGQVYALGVTAEVQTNELQLGDTLRVTITGSRSESQNDPRFIGANIQASGFWTPGGQSAHSPVTEGDITTKSWRFTMIAAQPGTTQVIPVIYLGSEPSLHSQADSVLGTPITVAILAPPGPPVWPWVMAVILLVVVSGGLIRRLMRGRSNEPYQRPILPPLEEALEMLESMASNRREDRAEQYLGDVQRVVQGYLTRRLDRSVAGWTAHEMADGIFGHVPDDAIIERLRGLLTQCDESKFSGARIEFDTLRHLESEARQVLEQMDQTWV